MIRKFLLFFVAWQFVLIQPVFAYDNDVMHQKINKEALLKANVNNRLEDYGFSNGIDTYLDGESILEIIEKGGEKEDEPWIKVTNHFHDPTQSWSKTTDNAKLDYWLAYGSGARSSVRWAQDSWNSWSWQKAREKMYKGLTSISESKREEYLADAFQSLGQVMHLIADSACPPHVRNDPHPPWDSSPYETYCENNATKIPFAGANPVPISIFQTSSVPGMEPITNLWDTDNSAGYNTAIGSNSPNIGLAEYTNYNFFSKDTVFDPVYTYPSTSMAAQGVVIQDPGTGDESYYFSGTTSDGVPVTHYAKMDYFYTDLTTSLEQSKISLDEECFGDYANILVPKAVNYNAVLLDYFLRGKMDVLKKQLSAVRDQCSVKKICS